MRKWSNGEFRGVCARGAFELDFAWTDKKIVRLNIVSKAGGICNIAAGNIKKITRQGRNIPFKKSAGNTIAFNTEKDGIYLIR